MPDAWDTTVVSHTDGRHAELLQTHLLRQREIALPAPSARELAAAPA